jgi:uroporphyrinogen decarboxylase
MTSDRYERVISAIHQEIPDRVPWTLWGHFPAVPFLKYFSWEKANRDGEESAKAHLALLRALDYKMDMLKVTPFYRFMACQWGSKFHWENNDESPPTMEVCVKETKDWSKLWVLDPRKELREALRSVEILARDLYDMPFIYSIPSPIVQALHGVSDPQRVYADMKEQPDALKEGLETITQTTIDFAKECIAEGATGIFFGVGGGGDIWSRMNQNQLEEYALFYDKKILDAVSDAPIKLLHICSAKGENPQKNGKLMETGWFKKYPVNMINWDAHEYTWLDKAKEIYGKKFAICGGLNRITTLRTGTPAQVEEEVKKAIEDAGEGGGFMVGPGCTVNQDMPRENYNAVGRAIIKHGYYRR